MSHFEKSTAFTRNTPDEWVPLARDITTLVNQWSGRNDLIAYVGDNATAGRVAALFNPYIGEVEVSIAEAFGDIKPSEVANLTTRDMQYNWPKGVGLIFHEAMHAKFTTWDLKESSAVLTAEENSALHHLEESRIERLGITHFPKNQQFLRASSMELIVDEASPEALKSMTNVMAAGNLAILVLARVDAGILDAQDVSRIIAHVNNTLDADLLMSLTKIWREFQTITRPESSIGRMYALAKEWARLLQEESSKQGEDSQSGMDAGTLADLLDALSQGENRAERNAGRALEDQRTEDKWDEELKEREAQQSEQSRNEAEARKVFSSTTTSGDGDTRSAIVKERLPTPDEHAAAIRIGQELEKAKYRDRDKTDLTSMLPPGRMRGRALLQNAAYASRNLPRTAEPFRRSARRHTDEPTLTIGMMTDVSGSMTRAMEPAGVANWVFSEASRRIGARIASVYYGSSVIAGLAPGKHLEKITIRSANDNYESFDKAFRTLDGGLDLLNGSGARLLVVCSDGEYKRQEPEHAAKWLKRCEESGVGVLWLTFPAPYGSSGAQALCDNSAAEHHHIEGSPTEASYQIGATAAQALTRAGTIR